jgi:formamidopyrimidine-DNA glycosylase
MPEYPEIYQLARQMRAELIGKTISAVEVLQPACLNVSVADFTVGLVDARLLGVTQRGKWLMVETTQGYLLLSLGMGGEVLLTMRDNLPEKRRLIFDFTDGTCLAVNFWWFGYAHYARPGELTDHEMTARLGPNILDVSADELKTLLHGQRARLKSILLDQSRLAGMGNSYIHDVLFNARLHPLRVANTLTDAEIERLARAIHDGLQASIDKGGAFYEKDLYGKPGGYAMEDILIGYKDNGPCPVCGTPIEKIKTGSTTSFICPHCQPLE